MLTAEEHEAALLMQSLKSKGYKVVWANIKIGEVDPVDLDAFDVVVVDLSCLKSSLALYKKVVARLEKSSVSIIALRTSGDAHDEAWSIVREKPVYPIKKDDATAYKLPVLVEEISYLPETLG